MNNALNNVISYFFTVEFIPSLFAFSAIDIGINHVITKICHYNTIIMFGYFSFSFYFLSFDNTVLAINSVLFLVYLFCFILRYLHNTYVVTLHVSIEFVAHLVPLV